MNFNCEYDHVIIGAGIAGLTAAYKLKKANPQNKILLIEKSGRIGGSINSKKYLTAASESTIYEFGPNSFLNSSEPINELVNELGLESELISKNFKDSKRYLYFKNELIEIKSSPFAFLSSKLLSNPAKLRVLAEPFIARKPKQFADESVYDFISRRFGKEIAVNLVSNFLQGIWGGDANKLAAESTLKKLLALEDKHGSVLLGVILEFMKKSHGNKNNKLGTKTTRNIKDHKNLNQRIGLQVCGFRNGMQALTDRLTEYVGEESILLNTSSKIVSLPEISHKFYMQSGPISPIFTIELNRSNSNEKFGTIKARAMIIAIKAFEAARLLQDALTFNDKHQNGINDKCKLLIDLLKSIEYAPIALVAFTVKKSLIIKSPRTGFLKGSLDGFGFLFANQIYEGGEIKNVDHNSCLGTIWSSELFEERKLKDEYLMTCFLGGAAHKEIVNLSIEQIQGLAIQEHIKVLNPLAKRVLTPDDFKIVDSLLIPKAIPQYNLGHSAKIDRILSEIKQMPGLSLVGNYIGGVSLGDAIS